MKTILAVILLFFLNLNIGFAAYSVMSAKSKGYISISASSSSSYSTAKVIVKNKTAQAIDIDFSTTVFVQNNDSQRIGLSYELKTRSYILRLRPGVQYTLYFSSRCLDLNRHSPTSGQAYAKFYTISSNFVQIINALRNKYSQSAVWNITDKSSISSAWKNADPRPKVGGYTPTINYSGYIDLSGQVSWQTSGNYINIVAAKIANTSSTITSGTLRIRVWATRYPYTGGTISGYVLGTRQLAQLQPNYYYHDISGYVAYSRPPSGYYYTTMTVEEYDNGSYYIVDYINFSGTTYF